MVAAQILEAPDDCLALENSVESHRRCIASNVSKPMTELLRFVVGPGNSIVPDITGRLPGRGIWLSADRISIKTACDRRLFDRAARHAVIVDDRLDDRIESLLVRQCTDLLGLARRAGQAVAGFVKVRSWLQQGQAALLFSALDGAADGREKLQRMTRGVPVVTVLRAEELGVAFARDRSVHVAVASGGLATKLTQNTAKLSGFRQPPENEEDDE